MKILKNIGLFVLGIFLVCSKRCRDLEIPHLRLNGQRMMEQNVFWDIVIQLDYCIWRNAQKIRVLI